MYTTIKSLLILLLLLMMQIVNAASVLVEAESFNEKGGWVMDQQFTFKMGSPYLFAHGTEKPVLNAKTSVAFPEQGKYHVWARTMTPHGDQKLKGRFKLVVNGKQLKEELGKETDWSWQYCGKVKVRKKTVSIELKDLTGLEVKCDAVYFSKTKKAPPDNNDLLETWRRQQKMNLKVKTLQFDLVVVGGGMAASAAAISAAEKGLKVALLNDLSLLEGNAAPQNSVYSSIQYGFFERIITMIDDKQLMNGAAGLQSADEEKIKNISSYDNISVFMNYQVVDVVDENKIIKFVLVRKTDTDETMSLKAKVFADCTYDAWMGYWVGRDSMVERESILNSTKEVSFRDDAEAIRILYPTLYLKNVDNLFMIGRNLSYSNLLNSVSPAEIVSAQIGCVVGYAASLCVIKGISPPAINQKSFSQLLDFIKSSDDEKVFIDTIQSGIKD